MAQVISFFDANTDHQVLVIPTLVAHLDAFVNRQAE